MKIYYLFVLFLFSIALGSCEKSNEEKAKESIRKYLNENLDDMSTYESVKFDNLDTVYMVESGTSIDSENVKYKIMYQMFHSYRLKDVHGVKYLTKAYFKINNNFEVIENSEISFIKPGNKIIPTFKLPSEKEVEAYLNSLALDSASADTAVAF
ncbi:hypothetical protein [Aquirufa sp.]|jgi:hypothetical protein|uniref:hypothetical protein n=1 Tax=Aquirufa sp. TaxID=2676249 RepID=UPI00378485BA